MAVVGKCQRSRNQRPLIDSLKAAGLSRWDMRTCADFRVAGSGMQSVLQCAPVLAPPDRGPELRACGLRSGLHCDAAPH